MAAYRLQAAAAAVSAMESATAEQYGSDHALPDPQGEHRLALGPVGA